MLKLTPELIERTLVEFRGLPHRLELVRKKNGVTFVDDSKGTNVSAVVQALAAVQAPILLIAGGVTKGGSYTELREPLRQKVKLLLLYGAARKMMQAALSGTTRLLCVPHLRQGGEQGRRPKRCRAIQYYYGEGTAPVSINSEIMQSAGAYFRSWFARFEVSWRGPDPWLYVPATVLVLIGTLMVLNTTYFLAGRKPAMGFIFSKCR